MPEAAGERQQVRAGRGLGVCRAQGAQHAAPSEAGLHMVMRAVSAAQPKPPSRHPPTWPCTMLSQVGQLESSKSGMYTLAPLRGADCRAGGGGRLRSWKGERAEQGGGVGRGSGEGAKAAGPLPPAQLQVEQRSISPAAVAAVQSCAPPPPPPPPPPTPPVERVDDHLAVGGPCDLHTPVLQAHMGGAGRPRGTRWAGGEATGWAGAAPPAPALLHLPASSRARTAVRQSFPAPGHAHLQVGRQRRHLPVPLADLLGHRGAAGGQRRWGLDSCTAQAPAQLGHRGDSHGTATAQQRHSRGTAARTCWVSGRKLGWPPAS